MKGYSQAVCKKEPGEPPLIVNTKDAPIDIETFYEREFVKEFIIRV
jgi:hypothetical protein